MDAEYLNKHLKCSYNDKIECLRFTERIFDLIDIYMEKGLYAIEDAINSNETYNIPLIKKGISLICDGREPKLVENILYNYIIFSDYAGKEFLKNIIVADTLILLYTGKNPYNILDLVSSYFGLEFYDSFQKFYTMYDTRYGITIEQIKSTYKDTKSFSKNTLILEPYLELLMDDLIKVIIEQCSTYELTHALRGASGEIKILFLSHMFKRQRYMMNYYISTINIKDYEGEIIFCQKQILNSIKTIKLDII